MKRANVNYQAARVVALVAAKVVAKVVGAAQAGMPWADVVRNSPIPTVAAILITGLMAQSYFGSSLSGIPLEFLRNNFFCFRIRSNPGGVDHNSGHCA